ncbi:hypothetical protein CLOSPI_00423 [Thomasclavelia spiroformis DSM 1552]|uniref:Uncharacterized protein n=1 Tax=Thomasclavelia spiroformis DSM 1552 TaxID=428126 RepID=B1BZP5_9FIRM|nr:hypothetical protein CLOSPI_00423 [Thomasclavelia spiroformis DSM 1552]
MIGDFEWCAGLPINAYKLVVALILESIITSYLEDIITRLIKTVQLFKKIVTY